MKDQFRARQVALWLNLVPDLVCKQLHDQIGLFQPLFLKLIPTETYPGLNPNFLFVLSCESVSSSIYSIILFFSPIIGGELLLSSHSSTMLNLKQGEKRAARI